jgi:hypothetical protein
MGGTKSSFIDSNNTYASQNYNNNNTYASQSNNNNNFRFISTGNNNINIFNYGNGNNINVGVGTSTGIGSSVNTSTLSASFGPVFAFARDNDSSSMPVFNNDYNNIDVVDSNVGFVAQNYTDNKLGEIQTRKRGFDNVDIERDERPHGKRKKLSRRDRKILSVETHSDLLVRYNYKYTDMLRLHYSDFRLLNMDNKIALTYQYSNEYKEMNNYRPVFNYL